MQIPQGYRLHIPLLFVQKSDIQVISLGTFCSIYVLFIVSLRINISGFLETAVKVLL